MHDTHKNPQSCSSSQRKPAGRLALAAPGVTHTYLGPVAVPGFNATSVTSLLCGNDTSAERITCVRNPVLCTTLTSVLVGIS